MVCIVIGVLYFAIHVSTVFTVLQVRNPLVLLVERKQLSLD